MINASAIMKIEIPQREKYVTAGKYLQKRRMRLNYTLEAVVEQLEQHGVRTSKSALSRLETGQGSFSHYADPKFVKTLAQVLRTRPESILELLGHIDLMDDPDSRERQIMSLAAQLDPDGQDIAVKLLEALVTQQNQQ